ncbi:MAG: hypothetical protein AAGD38_10550 [Acidobacteriota bacterium]
MKGTFKATTIRSAFGDGRSFSIDRFVDRPASDTPGDVGVCLSGGGSRALSTGMGQLRALAHIQVGDSTLLGQTKALSVVSGGGWLAIPFTYLTAGTSDDDYLNRFVADPGRLVPTETPGHTPAEVLDHLPEGNVANAVTDEFSLLDLAIKAALLWFDGTPAHFLWQALMATAFLEPYGLSSPHRDSSLPTTTFSFDAKTVARDIVVPNPDLGFVTAHVVDQGPERHHRPFLISNSAMFVNEEDQDFELLVPVQATPFVTGIVGAPSPGTDANGRAPGGGGVTSFAFNSALRRVDSIGGMVTGEVDVEQQRQWSLADILGVSSAAFAQTLQNLFTRWRANPREFLEAYAARAPRLEVWRETHLSDRAQVEATLETLADPTQEGVFDLLDGLKDIIPEYRYWPVLDAQADVDIEPTRFADGGNLENTGVAGMLTYSDIRRVIAFFNSSVAIEATKKGAFDASGKEIPGTRVKVDAALPPLFGYQPFEENVGYRLYAGDAEPKDPVLQHNQLFPAERFAELLRGLWQTHEAGAGTVVAQNELSVLDNAWFGIEGDRTVDLLWVYLDKASVWESELSNDVRALLRRDELSSFPNFSTLDTELDPTQINLLAHLTSWVVASSEKRELFTDMYRD